MKTKSSAGHRLLVALLALLLGLVALPAQTRQRADKGQSRTARTSTAAERQAQLIRRYGQIFISLVPRLTSKASSIISPVSGREFRGEALLDQGLGYSAEDDFVSCRVRLMWQARDFWRNVPYDWCEVVGVVRYYPPRRSIDKPTAIFSCEHVNEHVRAVATAESLVRLEAPIELVVDTAY